MAANAAPLIHAKKVLIITACYPPNIKFGGGLAFTYSALSRRLSQRGADVTVLSPQCHNLEAIAPVCYPGFALIAPSITNITKIFSAIGNTDCVVICDGMLGYFWAYIARLRQVPVLNNIHTNAQQILRSYGFSLAPEIVDGFLAGISWIATASYTTSPSYVEALRKRGYRIHGSFSPRIKTAIFNEHDTEDQVREARQWLVQGAADDRPVLLYVGRWSAEKRLHLLAKTKPDNTILVFVGDGPDADNIMKLHDPAKRIFPRKGIISQARLRVLYKAADFLVSASNFESLGMTVLEANLCGTPAIVQDADGFCNQIVKGKNGYLVDYAQPEDKARAEVAEAIAKAPTREDVERCMEEHQWDAELEQLDDIVDGLAGGHEPFNRACMCVLPVWLILLWVLMHLFLPISMCMFHVKVGQEHRAKRRCICFACIEPSSED